MKLKFNDQKAFFAHLNTRAEQHGEDQEPAADLKLVVNLPNDRLGDLHPKLKPFLYHFDKDRKDTDLADKGNDAPHLQFQKLGLPLRWTDEMAGATLKIGKGAGRAIALKDVKVNKLLVDPKEGGTLELTFRVQAHPTEEQIGKLFGMMKSEVRIALEPGEDAAEA